VKQTKTKENAEEEMLSAKIYKTTQLDKNNKPI